MSLHEYEYSEIQNQIASNSKTSKTSHPIKLLRNLLNI